MIWTTRGGTWSSLAKTLHCIDEVLASPELPPLAEPPIITEGLMPGLDVVVVETPARCSKTRLDWSANGVKTVIYCKFPADPATGLCRFHSAPAPALGSYMRGLHLELRPACRCVAEPVLEVRAVVTGPTVERPGWLERLLRRLFG